MLANGKLCEEIISQEREFTQKKAGVHSSF